MAARLGSGVNEINHISPDVPGLQLPEAFTTASAVQDFWELKSMNIWRSKVGDHCLKSLLKTVLFEEVFKDILT